jgi:hypothetical protein
MQIALNVEPSRNWANSWKRTIDGLEPLLGRTYPNRDWNPQDGRIIRLGLHLAVDAALEHDVEATIWATPADLDWPELAWLKRMTDGERRAFMAAHQAVLDGTAGLQRSRPMTSSPQVATPQPSRRGGRPPTALPEGVTELTNEANFEQAVADGALIVKTDSANPPKLHLKPEKCSGVSADNFRLKVIVGGGKNRRYYRITNPGKAKERWPRLGVCGTCRQLDPTAATAIDALLSQQAASAPRPRQTPP